MKLLKEWLTIIGIWLVVALGFLAIIIKSDFDSKKAGVTAPKPNPVRRLSAWHVEQVEQYFKTTTMKPARWGVSVEDVNGATISIALLTMERTSKEEAELNLRYMCPPDDARLWYGLNEHNTIYLNVRYPLDFTTSLGWWKCEGPKVKAIVSPTVVVK